jgi:hypothetical protein
MDKDDIKRVEDLLALVESNIRAIREYLDERLEEVEELEDQIMALVRKDWTIFLFFPTASLLSFFGKTPPVRRHPVP